MKKRTFIKGLILAVFVAMLGFTIFRLSQTEFAYKGSTKETAQSPGPSRVEKETPNPTPTPSPTPTPTPTPSPSPSPTPIPEPEVFTISMIGDCTLASTQYLVDFENVINGDYSYPFKNTVEYFEDDYLSIGNLECSLSDEKLYGSTTFYFCGDDAHGEILKSGGMDFMTLANNHTDDFGEKGLENTKLALDSYEIAYAGPNESYVYCRDDGLKIGLYSARWIAGEEEILEGIRKLKEENDLDIIISLMHWGLEGSYYATQDQALLGEKMIDAGVDIVYGSHPHVLQSIVSYENGYIVNSLGNYVFGGNNNPRDKDTAIVQFDIVRDYQGNITIEPWRAIPCRLSTVTTKNDYCPTPYEEGSEEYERTMSKLDGTFTGANLVVDYSNVGD